MKTEEEAQCNMLLSEELRTKASEENKETTIKETIFEEQVSIIEDDEREWTPAPAKITVTQRDAPPAIEFGVNRGNSTSLVKLYHAIANNTNAPADKEIFFSREDDSSPLCIEKVSPNGPFESSGFLPGMVVSAINGKYMTWESPEAAMEELRRNEIARVTCEDAAGKMYHKDHTICIEANVPQGEDCGIEFARKGENYPLYVHHVDKGGPFPEVLPGMKVVAINDYFMTWESPERAVEALSLSQSGTTKLTFEAIVENVNMMIHKIDLEMGSSKDVLITDIVSYSDRFHSGLKKGMRVLALNGHTCNESKSVDMMTEGCDHKWDFVAVDLDCQKVTMETKVMVVSSPSTRTEDSCVYDDTKSNETEHESESEDHALEESTSTQDGRMARAGGLVQSSLVEDVPSQDSNNDKPALAGVQAQREEQSNSGFEAKKEEESNSTTILAEATEGNESKQNQTDSFLQNTDNSLHYAKEETAPEDNTLVEVVLDDTNVLNGQAAEDASFCFSLDEPFLEQSSSTRFSCKTARAGNEDRGLGLTKGHNGRTSMQKQPDFLLRKTADHGQCMNEEFISEDNDLVEVVLTDAPFFIEQDDDTSVCFSLDETCQELKSKMKFSFQIKKICDEDLGLGLMQGYNGGIYVSSISESSKFRSTGLKNGMRIDSVNGIPCPNSMRVATALIDAVEGDFELITTFGPKAKPTVRHEIFFTPFEDRF
eukprot:scaffold23510_cov115-Cylindrotheca_fusiformis.AAC.1